MENYYVRIITKNMRNAHVEAQRRATKEYYPPHLTGHGSRGVGPLDMVLFALGLLLKYASIIYNTSPPRKLVMIFRTTLYFKIATDPRTLMNID